MNRDVVLVGEDNPYCRDPRYALYPAPEGSAGARLCKVVLGLSVKEYIKRFERVNLCAATWSMPEARRRAAELFQVGARRAASHRESSAPHGSASRRAMTYVLLGAKVVEACSRETKGVPYAPYSVWELAERKCSLLLERDDQRRGSSPLEVVVVLPHPSGRSRAWNEPGSIERARVALRAARVID